MAKLKFGKDGFARLQASRAGEWPTGIHYVTDEIRKVPKGYPGASDDLPSWVAQVKAKAPKKDKADKADD